MYYYYYYYYSRPPLFIFVKIIKLKEINGDDKMGRKRFYDKIHETREGVVDPPL